MRGDILFFFLKRRLNHLGIMLFFIEKKICCRSHSYNKTKKEDEHEYIAAADMLD